MNGIDQALFLWLNLVPDAPGWLLEAARGMPRPQTCGAFTADCRTLRNSSD